MSYVRRLFTEATLVHFPVGIYSAWVSWLLPVLGVVLSFGFLVYEVIEDWRIKDRGYRDVFGFLIGYGLMAGLLVAWVYWR